MDTEDDKFKCMCCMRPVDGNLHNCPFALEINNDETLCNCCDDCEHQCAMDI